MTKTVVPPVHASVTIARRPDDVFQVFTRGMTQWWPLHTHSVAADTFEGKARAEKVVFEGRVGGRIYERMDDGREVDWGQVLVWEPPHRVVFSWKPNLDPAPPTEVEVKFIPEGSGTRVDLQHRGWERLGEEGLRKRQVYETGWPGVIDVFARHLSNA